MRDPLFIGVDIGTQGTKAALFSRDGRLLAESFEPSRLITPREGEVTQEPEEIVGLVARTIRELFASSGEEPGRAAAIGIDGQMAGILGVDEDFRAVTPYDSWLDTRCGKYIPVMKVREEEIISKTGGQVTYAHGPKILWWKGERPDDYRRIAKFVTLSGYAAGRLCGLSAGEAFIDTTYLHFTGFADNRGKQWDEALLEAFGVDGGKLPAIVPPETIVGCLTAEAAAACGLPAGVPVAAGCGDTAASSLGAGILEKGQAYDVAGTASVFACCTDRFTPDVGRKTLLFARSAVEGLYIPLAYIGGGGLCLKWFADARGMSLRELDRLAEEVVAGSGGLFFLPHFSGRTCPADDRVRGGWLGLTFAHGDGALYRSILEAVAYEYHSYLEALREAGEGTLPRRILGAGGGAKSRLFCQIKADVLGIPYYPLERGDTAPFGAAMLAGFGAGEYGSLREAIAGRIETGEPILPRPEMTARYQPLARRYLEILDAAGSL